MLISVELPIPEIQVNTTPVWIKKLSIWSIGGLRQIKEVWHVNRNKKYTLFGYHGPPLLSGRCIPNLYFLQSKNIKMKSKIVLPFALLFLALLLFTSCKKDKTTQADFNYLGEWTVNYNFTTGSMARGVFKATIKSDGKWDYVEGSNSRGNAGTWTYSGNSISFEFNFSGLAKYDGTKINDNSLSGTAVGDAGVSTGTWTATR